MAITLNKNTLCFKVFHMDSDDYQGRCRAEIKKKLDKDISEFGTELDTPTVAINSFDSLFSYYKNNPPINIDFKGTEAYKDWGLNRGSGWKLGELGIWATNVTAWQNFLASDFEYALFMEDDFEVNEQFKDLLFAHVQELPDDWDMFSCGLGDWHLYSPEVHDIGQPNVCKSYHNLTMVCYLINKSSVKKMLDSVKERVAAPFDIYMLYKPNIFNTYAVKPDVPQGCRCLGDKLKSTFQYKETPSDLSFYFQS